MSQRLWNFAGKERLALLREVAFRSMRTRFILDLEQNHRSLVPIHLLQMVKQRANSPFISLECSLAMRRQHWQSKPIGRDSPPESLRLQLHPTWRIFHSSILPGTKPEQNQLEAMFPRSGNHIIDNRKVKGPFCRLDLLPIHRNLSSIGVHANQNIPQG